MATQQPRRRRHIRWDRIIVTAVILVTLIFLLGSCIHSCGGNEESSSVADTGSSTSENSTVRSGSSSASADGSSSAEGSSDASADTAPAVSTADIPSDYQYVTMVSGAVYSGTLVLVDGDNPSRLTTDELDLVQVYYSTDRPSTYEISYPGHTQLNKTAITQFNRLMHAYYTATENTEIMFNYGYLEAGKEHSNAESATALDIQLHLKYTSGGYNYISYTSPYTWLFDHMANYGFILRYPENKGELTGQRPTYTAIRYVGVPHAAYIAEHDLCLEEYLQLLQDEYQFGQNMLEYSTAEQTYHIYYVPASRTGDTEVPVPNSGTWEISGNNIGGFIVTIYAG